MRRTLIRIQLLATALAFGLLTACDTGPSEPPAPDLTEVGISLVGAGAAGMSPRDSVGVSPGDTVVAQCMAGGTRLATFDRSVSHENGIIVESTEIFTRFDDCGVSRRTASCSRGRSPISRPRMRHGRTAFSTGRRTPRER